MCCALQFLSQCRPNAVSCYIQLPEPAWPSCFPVASKACLHLQHHCPDGTMGTSQGLLVPCLGTHPQGHHVHPFSASLHGPIKKPSLHLSSLFYSALVKSVSPSAFCTGSNSCREDTEAWSSRYRACSNKSPWSLLSELKSHCKS